MNYILGKFLGYEFAFNILTFLFVYIYAITVFKVVYRMCKSPSSAVLSTLFLLSSHAFVSSYFFHAETPRVKTAKDKGYFFLTSVRIFSLLSLLLFARIGFRRLRSLD